ncbi:TRAP transporter small permease [Paraburkholderia antibiotica]|uniref:TRAP transporter small permease protein n=1 Tax=Paraburkholderia antibiotica TaxID=2728839 RepID=A0A7Y0A078_9BURK|nr:TRAP transporter small permease [Paraburkholderia antibiotica]NML34103.1 TRAP transporter small permease [Paraburkholderia antibiotica]
MSFLKRPNDFLFRVLLVLASVSLAALCLLVIYSVVMRYVFADAPDFVEPIALLLVILIAMFGAALKVREGGHIGLDSLVKKLPPKGQVAATAIQHICLIAFAVAVFVGCWEMAETTMHDRIPIIGVPEGLRYCIPIVASVCIALFSFEHLLDLFSGKRKEQPLELSVTE